MSFIACCFVLLHLGLTANVYFPYAKGARGMTYSFFAGWFAGELALQLTLVQMLLTLVMLITGSFSGLLGSLGLLLLFANWLALLHHYYQGRSHASLLGIIARQAGFGPREWCEYQFIGEQR